MPHVIIKMQAGRSDTLKREIAEAVIAALMASAGVSEASLSIAIEDVAASDWVEAVYRPDILGRPETIIKQPGYDPLL